MLFFKLFLSLMSFGALDCCLGGGGLIPFRASGILNSQYPMEPQKSETVEMMLSLPSDALNSIIR